MDRFFSLISTYASFVAILLLGLAGIVLAREEWVYLRAPWTIAALIILAILIFADHRKTRQLR
jgi:hypothetical protein